MSNISYKDALIGSPSSSVDEVENPIRIEEDHDNVDISDDNVDISDDNVDISDDDADTDELVPHSENDADDPLASQLSCEKVFEEPVPYPEGIEWGSKAAGGIDVPHATRRLAWKWMLQNTSSNIRKRIPVNTYDISTAIKVMFGRTLAFCGVWYEWHGPHWEVFGGKSMDLKTRTALIKTKYVQGHFYINVIKPIISMLESMDEEEVSERWGIDSSFWQWKKALFQSDDLYKYIRDLPALLNKPESWQRTLGSRSHLLGFKCGKIFNSRTCKFIDGTPEHMLCKVLPHTMEQCIIPNPEIRKELLDFVSSVSINEEVATYHQNFFSLVISGDLTREHQFFNYYGPGRNGKSAIIALYENALGTKHETSYCQPANIKLITTNDTKLEGTNSAVMSCRGALLVTMSEPGPGESLAVEVVKRLCGGDSVTGRSLYGNIETYDWTAHMLVAANKTIPSGMDYSEAIALRIRVIPFPYIFKQDANTAEDSFEKEIDFNLFKKLKGEAVYGAQYMGMAIENLKRLLDEHEKSADRDKKSLVTIPEYVQNAIKEYQQSNNPMEEFFNENVLKKRDSIILQGNIMRRFKWWIDAEYPGDRRFGRIEFEDLKTCVVKFGMTHMKTAGGRWGFHNF